MERRALTLLMNFTCVCFGNLLVLRHRCCCCTRFGSVRRFHGFPTRVIASSANKHSSKDPHVYFLALNILRGGTIIFGTKNSLGENISWTLHKKGVTQ